MKVGVTLATNDLVERRPIPFAEMVDAAVRAEEMGYDSVWVLDHVFVDRGEFRAQVGPDPLILLTAIAARTKRIELGTLVLCAPFRLPVQLARETKALQEVSGGRFILGIGAGWHQPEFDAFGIPFDHLVGRLEDYTEVLTRLLGDGRASFEGPHQVLREGQVFGESSPPPWIAARGPRMLRLTGRLAGGWNGAWYGPDPSVFRRLLGDVEAALAEAGRDRSTFSASAGIFVLPGDPATETAIGGSAAEIVDALGAYRRAGCDHAILNFAPMPFSQVDAGHAEKVAPLLDLIRG